MANIQIPNLLQITYLKCPNLSQIPILHWVETPHWFLSTIADIINSAVDTPLHPPLRFDLSQAAAESNMRFLKAYGDSIQALIEAHPGSFLCPGSEFRPVACLETLLMHHPNWPLIINSLTRGSVWPLLPISNEERVTKNIEFIARGNHKSAIKYNDEYLKIVKAEISQGWMFPIPLHYINTLMHGELAPVGIDDKVWSEQADGSKKRKLRLTHDQSFEASCGSSVNGRVIKEKLAPLFYGGCLSRIIHYVVDLRL